MKPMTTLPEGYQKIDAVDLEHNKKQMLAVNGLSIILMLIMAIGMNLLVPISTLFKDIGWMGLAIRLLVIAAALVLYILLHELTHGITMKLCGCHEVTYGFTGIYAFAACRDYFPKKQYFLVALSPVFLWGIVLTVICIFVPVSWFWVFYIVQITNISGAAGDLYVTFRFFSFPEDILIHDSGAAMTVYAPSKQ